MVETNTRSKEEQAASLQFELKNLEAERDAIPTYRASERQRVQSEIDKIQSHLDALNSGTRPEQKAEAAPKVELSVSDMVRLVVEYNNLKKAQSELNSAHSDRKRIDAELVKISEELKRNNVDTENRMMMGLIDTIQVVTKELSDLRNKSATVETTNEPTVETTSKPEDESDPAEAIFRNKSVEASDLITNLDKAITLLATDREKGVADIGRIVSLLEAIASEVEAAIGEIKNEETKQKYQERWNKKNVSTRVKEAKKLILAPEVDAENKKTGDEITKDEPAPNIETAGEEDSSSDSTEIAEVTETKSRFPRLNKVINSIRSKFVGGWSWFNKNASGHLDDEVKTESTKVVVGDKKEVVVKSKEQLSEELYDRHNKSLTEINRTIEGAISKKSSGELGAGDLANLVYALDSMYIIDDMLGDDKTNLNEDQRQSLQKLVYDIGNSASFKSAFGIEYSDLMDLMELDVLVEDDLYASEEKRKEWLQKYFNKSLEPGKDESLSAKTINDEENITSSALDDEIMGEL